MLIISYDFSSIRSILIIPVNTYLVRYDTNGCAINDNGNAWYGNSILRRIYHSAEELFQAMHMTDRSKNQIDGWESRKKAAPSGTACFLQIMVIYLSFVHFAPPFLDVFKSLSLTAGSAGLLPVASPPVTLWL